MARVLRFVPLLALGCLQFEVVSQHNQLPVIVVKVTPESPVIGGTVVTLDASATADPDPQDKALTFLWEQVTGQPAALDQYDAAVVQFTAPRGNQLLIFFVHVSDGIEDVKKQVTVEVGSLTAPVARAGPDLVVSLGQHVILDGSGSEDKDGDPLIFQWEQLPGEPRMSLSGAGTTRAEFDAPLSPAQLAFRVSVSDGKNESKDDVTVEVKAIPESRIKVGIGSETPVLATGKTISVGDGDRVVLDGTASQPPPGGTLDGRRWTFPAELVLANPGLEGQVGESIVTFITPKVATALIVKLAVSARDGGGSITWSPEASVTMVITPRPLARTTGSPREVLNRTTITLDGTASEGAASYEWRIGTVPPGDDCCTEENGLGRCSTGRVDPPSRRCLTGQDTPTPNFQPYARGNYTVRLVVATAANVRSVPAYLLVNSLNNKPRASAGRDFAIKNHESTELISGYLDPDGDVIDGFIGTPFRWEVAALPAGAGYELEQSLVDSSRFTFTPHGKGAYFLDLIVNDGVVDSEPDRLVVQATNVAPLAAPITPILGKNRAAIQLSAGTSRDPDGDPLFFRWTVIAKPGGATATLSDATAQNPTLTPSGKGTYTVELLVSDGEANAPPAPVTVVAQNNPPVADAGPAVAGYSQTSLSLDGGRSYDADGDALSRWSWRKKAGPALSAFEDTDTVTPRVTFASVGTYTFGLTVSDGADLSVESDVTVAVTSLNRPPVVSAGPDLTVSPGAVVTLSGTAIDPDGDGIGTFVWTRESDQSALPDQLVGQTVSFTAPGTFDPVDADQNRITWRLEVSDNRGAISRPARVNVYLGPDEASFVFVKESGDDTTDCGGAARPCRSVNQAVRRAQSRPLSGRNILITGGTYDDEPVPSLILPYGTKLLGGWDPVSFRRDPKVYVSELKYPEQPIPERADGYDNDCDKTVDEEPVPFSAQEACNYLDDNGDGVWDNSIACPLLADSLTDAFEPNDSASEATRILLGVQYGGARGLASPNDNVGPKLWGSEDWYTFTLPVDVPADPDGSGTAQVAPMELWITAEIYLSPVAGNKSLTVYRKTQSGSLVLVASVANNIYGSYGCPFSAACLRLNGLVSGEYYFRFAGHSSNPGNPQQYRLSMRLVTNNIDSNNFENPIYCKAASTIYVIPRSTSLEEKDAPVIEGLRIIGFPAGISNTVVTDNNARAILVSGGAARIRDNEIIGGGSRMGAGSNAYAISLANTLEITPPPLGARPEPGVVIERNFISIPIADNNIGIRVDNVPDFAIRNNRLVAGNFLSTSRYVDLIVVTNASTGRNRGSIDGNILEIGDNVALLGECRGIYADSFKQLFVVNNVFRIRSDCGPLAGGAYFYNRGILHYTNSGATAVVANNVFIGRPDIINRSGGVGSTATTCNSPWMVRNNYFQDFDNAVGDCGATSPNSGLLQWNAFASTAVRSRPYYVQDHYGAASTTWTTLPQLAGRASGSLGSRPESLRNLAAKCKFEEDWTGSTDSPCLDVGSRSAPVIIGMDAATELLALDMLGQPRPVDLAGVSNGPDVADGTTDADASDIGPVERQAP